MGQTFAPQILNGMWVVAFGRQVQQHNGIGASIVADRSHGLHTLLVGEVAVAARDAVNQKCRSTGRGQEFGAVVGLDGQHINAFGDSQKGFGDVAQISGQRKFQPPMFDHKCAAHVFVVRHPNSLEFGFGGKIQGAFVESHQIPGDPDLARFFLLTAFQNGGHLVGGKGFGNVEMDMIAIEMGGENAGQIAPTEM